MGDKIDSGGGDCICPGNKVETTFVTDACECPGNTVETPAGGDVCACPPNTVDDNTGMNNCVVGKFYESFNID